MAESVPYEYIDSSGLIIPQTADILTDVQSEYTAVFGADLVLDPSSPEGVLITAETLARTQVVNNNAALANQINPSYAGGVFLDAILALTGLQRTANKSTLVNANLTGAAGTVIPEGSQAQTAAGDIFASTSSVTLSGAGTASVQFASVAFGPIPCATDALDIITPPGILGWETIINPLAGTLGTLQQPDEAARAGRLNMLAFQGLSLPAAIISALYAVPGVQSVFFQENVSASTQTINGISMVSHSVYACVNGGTNTAVATALLENKSSGAAWNGGTSVDVVEPASGQTYTVTFDRPTPEPILVEVTIALNTAPVDSTTDVQGAVLDYFAGNVSGVQGIGVGSSVSAFEISSAVVSEYSTIFVRLVRITLASNPTGWQTAELDFAVNQIATVNQSDIFVITI